MKTSLKSMSSVGKLPPPLSGSRSLDCSQIFLSAEQKVIQKVFERPRLQEEHPDGWGFIFYPECLFD